MGDYDYWNGGNNHPDPCEDFQLFVPYLNTCIILPFDILDHEST